MENKKALVQPDWLTELPTMEKPECFNRSKYCECENCNSYWEHITSLKKICRCEGLKDGAIVEEGVDFQYKRGKQLHTTDQQQWQEMSVSEKDEYFEKVAIPLHREQGEQLYCLTDWGALLKVERMADAGKKITTVCVSDPDAVDAGMEISTEDIIRFFGKEEYLKLKTTPHPSTPAGKEERKKIDASDWDEVCETLWGKLCLEGILSFSKEGYFKFTDDLFELLFNAKHTHPDQLSLEMEEAIHVPVDELHRIQSDAVNYMRSTPNNDKAAPYCDYIEGAIAEWKRANISPSPQSEQAGEKVRVDGVDIKENARLFAESKMQEGWDRLEKWQIVEFYIHMVNFLCGYASSLPPKPNNE